MLTLLKPARNVVQLYGLCANAWDGRLRLVLELCDHGNVQNYLKALPRDKVITGPEYDPCGERRSRWLRHCSLVLFPWARSLVPRSCST